MMDLHVDEAEHSMEMHLPYLVKVFQGYDFCQFLRHYLVRFLNCLIRWKFLYRFPVKIVPILVGALSAENEAKFGQLLAKYVDDPTNFFSVSSDFCHWGSRYVIF